MSNITDLKTALVNELVDQVSNGTVVVDKDSGEVIRVSTPANVLSVAAKVVKDFSDEIDTSASAKEEQESLKRYMDRHRNLKVVND